MSGLAGAKFDSKQPTLDQSWNSVEVVSEPIPGRVVVRSEMYPDLTRQFSIRRLLGDYVRRVEKK